MSPGTAFPRYEIHLCIFGVTALLVSSAGAFVISPPLGYRSLESALAACDKHAGRDLEWSHDHIGGFAAVAQ